jgi:hypothetical protein
VYAVGRGIRKPGIKQRVSVGHGSCSIGAIAQVQQRFADDDEVDCIDEEDVVVADVDGAGVGRLRQGCVSAEEVQKGGMAGGRKHLQVRAHASKQPCFVQEGLECV